MYAGEPSSGNPPAGYTYGTRGPGDQGTRLLDHNTGAWVGDAEPTTFYNPCPGNYVCDYSDIVDGKDQFTAQIDCAINSSYPADDFLIAWPHWQ
jgi:hypothetical protein